MPGETSSQPENFDLSLAPLVRQARRDLAKRLKVNVEEIEVVQARMVQWPDTSLGCPRPGMLYPQILQDGTFIQLQADGKLYNYHSGRGRPPFLCEQ